MSVFFELVGTNVVTIIKIRKAEYRIIRYSAFLKSGATSSEKPFFHFPKKNYETSFFLVFNPLSA